MASARLVRPGEADSPPREARAAPVIYTHADKDVEPAVALRQYLPTATTDRVTDTPGELDIVVSETGEVESVRLVSSTNRFQERMLVAAAPCTPSSCGSPSTSSLRAKTGWW